MCGFTSLLSLRESWNAAGALSSGPPYEFVWNPFGDLVSVDEMLIASYLGKCALGQPLSVPGVSMALAQLHN